MFRCNECGTEIVINNPIEGTIVECDICGIELEVSGNILLSRQLGPSEE
jgi:lysine biosynthesis protein LysW